MGIDFELLEFYDTIEKNHKIEDPVLGLGSIQYHETYSSISKLTKSGKHPNFETERTVANLFLDRYGVNNYIDCDVNGESALHIDLSKPIPKELTNQFNTVINAGTAEHIFDLRSCFRNIHDLTKKNGIMVHNAPVSWINHGFINFNPLLFRLLAEANQYEVISHGVYFSTTGEQAPPEVIIFDQHQDIDESFNQVFSEYNHPKNCVYLIALKKANSEQFATPYQID